MKDNKELIEKAHKYASKQGDEEYQSSYEDFIAGYKEAL